MSFVGDDSTYDIQQRDLRRIMNTDTNIQQAKREVWEAVFQVVSDNPQLATREFIRKLEEARDMDGCGPLVNLVDTGG